MEPYYLRLQIIAFLSIFLLTGITASGNSPENDNYPPYEEKVVKERIKKLENTVVPPQYNSVVKSYILTYTERRREAAQRIIGRSVMYFPMFEQYLRQHKLPLDLKYLPIVESALNPKAVSRVGAVGLWQFMPGTARWIGLEVSEQVDERVDPNASTNAALVYLAQLYDRFGDWELAIAAYNGGGGRVSRAIKRARSKNFWKIRRFLPRETRNYVPAFIAAYYLMHHYEDHNILPEYPDLDLQLTKSTKVYNSYTFYQIAQITGLPLDVIRELNPAYVDNQVPQLDKGAYLTLPTRVMPAFQDFVDAHRPDPQGQGPLMSAPVFVTRPAGERNADYIRSVYTIRAGETMGMIAQRFGCTIHQIRTWNKLKTARVAPGQQLIVYHPREYRRFRLTEEVEALAPLVTLSLSRVDLQSPIWVREQKNFVTKGGHLYYHLKQPERVFELAGRLPDIGIRDLLQLNGYKNPMEEMKKDTYVRIKKL